MTPEKFTKQDIEKDKKYLKLVNKKQIKPATQRLYTISLHQFCNYIEKSPTELITILKNLQKDRIIKQIINGEEELYIDRFNPNDSLINDMFDDFIIFERNKIDYMRKGNIKQNTVKTYVTYMRSFFKFYDLELPDKTDFKDDSKELEILPKSMIAKAIELGNFTTRALFSFMASIGARVGDIMDFTIEDFMIATYDSHHCTEVDDFLNKAQKDMIGYWEFYPIKTENYNIKCQTCNSPESSNYLLEYLQWKKRLLEKYNKKHGTDRYLHKKTKLFSPTKNTNAKYTYRGLYTLFGYMNTKLKDIIQIQLYEDYENKKISHETLDEKLQNIPRLNPHSMRRYFSSVLANNGVNTRLAYRMEGHADEKSTDKNYIKLSKETIMDAYLTVLSELTFQDTEVHHIKSKDYREMEERLDEVNKKLEARDKEHDNSLKETMDILRNVDPKVLKNLLEKNEKK
jgi:integrase